LIGRTLPERVIALVNKLVRRYLRWYINPIVEQQNAYNDAVARTLRLLAEAYADLAAQITDQQPTNTDEPTPESGGQQGVHSASEAQTLVRAHAAAELPARFPDLELQAQELQLKLRQNVLAHWPLPGKTLPQKLIAFINKLVRRYLRWYINPIVEQQNAANVTITAALLAMVRLDAERRATVAARRARNAQ
jgi:Arc/MetJ family transcription regulator